MKKIKLKMKKISIKKHAKQIALFVIGILLSCGAVYGATTYFASDEVSYDDTKTGDPLGASNAQEAVEKIYEKAQNCGSAYPVFMNVVNGTTSEPYKTVSANKNVSFSVTPNTDYGFENYDARVFGKLNCSNGQSASINAAGTSITLSNVTNKSECTLNLVRVRNFSYTTVQNYSYIASLKGQYCCSDSMPEFSSTVGTFKMTCTNHNDIDINNVSSFKNQYCVYSNVQNTNFNTDGAIYTIYSKDIYFFTGNCGSECTNTSCSYLYAYAWDATYYQSNSSSSCSWYSNSCATW